MTSDIPKMAYPWQTSPNTT